jgi:methylphosphotriester-DNA--protein-cysteine methyltransferase
MSIVTQHVDSPLGRWTHSEWRPAHLAGIVEMMGYFEGEPAHPRERVFPHGRLELFVHLSDCYSVVEGTRTERCPVACISGLISSSMVVQAPPGGSRVLGMRLHPAGAYALLGMPLSELAGITVDLRDLAGVAADELVERCQAATSAEERLQVAARWVAERVARSPRAEPSIAWTAAQIEIAQGAVSIGHLRERTGLSARRLVAAFREQIGAPPKLFARIHRVRRVLAMLNQGAGPLADIALDAGYYDQPHMNAEFRELTGLAPSEFIAATRYPGSISLAES